MKNLNSLRNAFVLALGLTAAAATAAPNFGAIPPRPGQPPVKSPDCSARAEQVVRDTQAAIDNLTSLFDQGAQRLVAAFRQEMVEASGSIDSAVQLSEIHQRYREMLASLSDLFTDEAIPYAAIVGQKSLSALPCGAGMQGAINQHAEEAKIDVQQTEAAADAAMLRSLAELSIR